MKRILYLSLTLSVLFLSTSAIDLNTWEFFTEDVTALAFSSSQGDRMGRLWFSSGSPAATYLQFYDPTTKSWINPMTNNPWLVYSANKIYVGLTEEFSLNNQDLAYRSKGKTASFFSRITNIVATDFAPSPTENKIWFLRPISGNVLVQYLNRATGVVSNTGMTASKITIDASGNPWIIDTNGYIYTWTGSGWNQRLGKAREISAGTNGIYIVTQDPTEGGYVIKKWNASVNNWAILPGIGGINVATSIGSSQEVYVITNQNRAYRMRGTKSSFCPGCAAGWQTPDGASYEGYCKADGAQCINCMSGTGYFDVGSTLSCKVCPALCETCSSSTVCTSCKENYFLSPTGVCRGPCDDEATDIYYYPKDGSCRPTCEVPITNPSLNYPTCQLCPDYNCLECTIPKFCTRCYSSHFLSPVGHCMSDCESPLVPSEPSPGDKRCKEPCGTNLYYDPDNDVCQA